MKNTKKVETPRCQNGPGSRTSASEPAAQGRILKAQELSCEERLKTEKIACSRIMQNLSFSLYPLLELDEVSDANKWRNLQISHFSLRSAS